MRINGYDFTIGADPELFIRKRGERRDVYHSAHGIVPGTKEEPHKVDGGAIQLDGVAAEFNIDPVTSEDEFVSNIKKVVKTLRTEFVEPAGYTLHATPVARFCRDYFTNEVPTENKELGCNPDWNARTGRVNPAPVAPETFLHERYNPYRTGSGHIHIGWGSGFDTNDPELMKACRHLVESLQRFFNLNRRYVLVYSKGHNLSPTRQARLIRADQRREQLYGRPYTFRPTTYGVEFRTPSNFWLNSEYMTREVYRGVEHSIRYAFGEYGNWG